MPSVTIDFTGPEWAFGRQALIGRLGSPGVPSEAEIAAWLKGFFVVEVRNGHKAAARRNANQAANDELVAAGFAAEV